MKTKLLGVVAALALLCAFAEMVSKAQAETVIYDIVGSGSGSLNGISFTNDPFVFQLVGDPALAVNPLGTDYTFINPLTSAAVSIDGFATATFTISTALGIDPSNDNAIFFSRGGRSGTTDLFDFYLGTSGSTFDFNAPYGPVLGTNVYALNQFIDVSTSGGPLTFSQSSDVLFSASTTPLPAALPLVATGPRRDRFVWLAQEAE